MQTLSLRTKNDGMWNWEAPATNFYYGKDITRTSTGTHPAVENSGPCTIRMPAAPAGTRWI